MKLLDPHAGDLFCFSHLRWDFVSQRPQHLMTRWARAHRVFFVEEPRFTDGASYLAVRRVADHLCVIVPELPCDLDETAVDETVADLLRGFACSFHANEPVLWFYTPMMLPWTRHLSASCVVYDCMDELTAFDNAHPALAARECELLQRADLVLTGGHHLYQARRHLHPNEHAFPSGVESAWTRMPLTAK